MRLPQNMVSKRNIDFIFQAPTTNIATMRGMCKQKISVRDGPQNKQKMFYIYKEKM